MQLLKNPSFIALIAVFGVGVLVGVPKATTFKDKVRSKNQQLNALSSEVETIRLNQRIQAVQLSKENATYRSQRKRDNILNPVFQITGDTAVGSAVLVKRVRNAEDSYYVALSCYHVIRDILAEQEGKAIETFNMGLVKVECFLKK